MTPLDPQLRVAIEEMANALQPAMLVAGQLRRELGAHVADAETLHEALQRAVTAIHTLRQGDAS